MPAISLASPEHIDAMDYRLVLTKREDILRETGNSYVISDPSTGESIVEQFSIEEDVDTPVIEVKMVVRLTDDSYLFMEGDHVSIYVPYVNFDGRVNDFLKGTYVILSIDRQAVAGRMNITMRNIAHWVTKIRLAIKIEKGETANSFITRTAEQHGIPIETLPSYDNLFPFGGGGFKLNATFFPSISLYDAWITALSIAMREDNKIYRLRFGAKGLIVEEIEMLNPSSKVWFFEVTNNHSNIINATRNTSIIDQAVVNVARGVMAPAQNDAAGIGAIFAMSGYVEEVNSESVEKYGVAYQEFDVSRFAGDEKSTRDYLKKMIEEGEPKDNIEFTTLALNSLLPLDRIYVTLPLLGLSGQYYVKHLSTKVLPNDSKYIINATRVQDVPFDLSNIMGEGEYILNKELDT